MQAARICVTITDEEKGILLRKQQSSVAPLAVDTHDKLPYVIIGRQQDFQVLPSVSIRVIVEYEKQGQMKNHFLYRRSGEGRAERHHSSEKIQIIVGARILRNFLLISLATTFVSSSPDKKLQLINSSYQHAARCLKPCSIPT